MDIEKYSITYQTGNPIGRTVEALVMWGFLGFLVYLSRGSVWWTFLFGTIAILAVAGRLAHLYKNNHKRFNTKAELRAFVDSLPE